MLESIHCISSAEVIAYVEALYMLTGALDAWRLRPFFPSRV